MSTKQQEPTYAEVMGEEPFNWNAFLEAPHTTEEWEEATELAGKWVTCACGNQCATLPRYESGRPKDEKLAHYGMNFYDALESQEAETAKAWLEIIEQRVTQLLAE